MPINRWGENIKKGCVVTVRDARSGTYGPYTVVKTDSSSNYAKAYGPRVILDSGGSASIDDVTIVPKRNPRHSLLADHAAAIAPKARKTRKAVKRNPAKQSSGKIPNRGYYIVQVDMSYGGFTFGMDPVTPLPWRVWRVTKAPKGYSFKIPEVVYDKPGFKEWAEKNSGPGYPMFVTLNQLRAMTKAFMK